MFRTPYVCLSQFHMRDLCSHFGPRASVSFFDRCPGKRLRSPPSPTLHKPLIGARRGLQKLGSRYRVVFGSASPYPSQTNVDYRSCVIDPEALFSLHRLSSPSCTLHRYTNQSWHVYTLAIRVAVAPSIATLRGRFRSDLHTTQIVTLAH